MRDHEREFCEFVQGSSRRLLHAAQLLTGDRERAEDLVQSALARTFLAWRRIRLDPLAYTRKVMLNHYTDWWRRRPWREQPSAQVPEPMSWSDHATDHAQRDAMLRALGGLTRRERAVVVLRFYEDLSEAEIAETLAIAPGTVKSTCARALAKLRVSPELTERPTTAEILR